MSERTYDESGDYVVDSFDLETREYSDTLTDHNDRIGIFTASSTPEIVENEEKLDIGFDPGKAYVKGNKIKTFSKKYVPVQKARNLKTLTESEIDLILADYGNYILVPSLATGDNGWKSFNFSPYAGGGDPFLIVNLCTENKEVIGTARLKDIKKSTSTDVSVGYRIYLFDIKLNTGREWIELKTIIKVDVRDGTFSGIDSTQPK